MGRNMVYRLIEYEKLMSVVKSGGSRVLYAKSLCYNITCPTSYSMLAYELEYIVNHLSIMYRFGNEINRV